MKIIFLDIDGVLNSQITAVANHGKKMSYHEQMICRERVSWLNELCAETSAKVVISSTWRLGREIEELNSIFAEVGATFEIIGKTPSLRHEGCVRGNEIHLWVLQNEDIVGRYYDFNSYAIIDDDSDMLLWQQPNFFKVDHYCGLTPNTCYKIKRFFDKFPDIL